MIVTLVLENFMAHGRTELDLANGLNVLCGPNNTGKSAVVEALRCLATNPAPGHVIRHGGREARVEVRLADGRRVAWVRRKAYPLYEVYAPGADEPVVYAKMGRGKVPPEVADILRLAPVDLEKNEEAVDVHLGDQRRPIFLLDRPGSTLAEFLASSTESAHLMAMQDALRARVRKAKADVLRVREARDVALSGLDRLAALPGANLALDALREQARDLEARASALPVLADLAGRLAELRKGHARCRIRRERLSGLAEPPAIRPAARLAGFLEAARRLRAARDAASGRLAALSDLVGPPALADAAGLGTVLAGQARLKARRERLLARGRVLETLVPPPLLADPGPLADLAAQVRQVRRRIADQARQAERLGQALEALAGRVAARLAEVGACPLCGSDLKPERFLARPGGPDAAGD